MHCAHIYHWLGATTCHATWEWYFVVTIFKLMMYGFLMAAGALVGVLVFASFGWAFDIVNKTMEKYHG